jgi:hypothetical protein
MLETHLAGKTNKKKQYSNSPDPPAHTKLLHTTLYRETRRAPQPPEASS